jgi:glycosyltransferase involved in cell wall biosynthesis
VKNVEALVAAWPAVRARMHQARLVIAGTGDDHYTARLRDDVDRLAISESVTFSGFVSGKDKALLLASASAFVLPSHHENFGVAVLEALAAGVPVVVSEHVQLAPFVAENNLGLVTSADSGALSEALIKVLTDSSLRTGIRERGPIAVERDYSPAAIAPLLMSMYESAAGSAVLTERPA